MKGKVLTTWSLIWLLATVFFVVGAGLNLYQRTFHELPPTDGVIWVQRENGIFAEKIQQGLAASRSGISVGDRLIGISLDDKQFDEISVPSDVQIYLEQAGVGGNLTYLYQKTAFTFKDNFYYADLRKLDTEQRWTASMIFLSIVGLVWLGIGLFVLLKQGGRSPFIIHFALVCLTAFVFHTYRSLGLGEDLDLAVSVLDDVAFALFAPLFLHFCLRYPIRSDIFSEQRWKTYALYVPSLFISAGIFALSLLPVILPKAANESFINFADNLDLFAKFYQFNLVHFVAGVSLGATVLVWRFFTNKQTVARQRLKWAMWGTISAVIPIIGFQIAKQFFDLPQDTVNSAITTLPLALIPFSFGHSVVRYRLMDVDVVVRRALVYALTTVAIALMIGTVAFGFVFAIIGADFSTTNVLRALTAIAVMAVLVLFSEPLKNFLQERADRFFYGEKYDLRRGLLDFGKTLSATTALEPLLNALTERLRQVLDVEKVAVFLESETELSGYRIAKSFGLSSDYAISNDFRQMIREKSAAKGIVRADELESDTETSDGQTLVRQELHYFVPCVARGKMVAVIGLGRASDGSLLSSEDLEILRTVSGYVAVAIENSVLYQDQEKRAEELSLLKEFNESIVESVNVGLLAVDENGRITRCNSTFEEMLGKNREESVGKRIEDIFSENFAETLQNLLGTSSWLISDLRHAYKLRTENSNGEQLILNVAIAPLRSSSKERKGAIIVLEDVTSRVKLEETLQQNEKLSSIGLLAAGVAHEVNTPLTGVSSYTQMLLGMIPETDPKHQLLLKVQKQTERASNIAGNLLNFSRVGNTTEFTEIDVNKILDDTLQLLEPQLRKSNVEIIKNYAEIPPKAFGNAGKLQQVFTNLILNARDAMFDGGKINLTTQTTEKEVVIEIKDNGQGIETDNLSKIYDPFFTTKGVGSGTGLGLAVTFGIVQEHAGTINVESEIGTGTTFRLEFPIAHKIKRRAVS
jgi:two-component system, NtrC family, sensor kinase